MLAQLFYDSVEDNKPNNTQRNEYTGDWIKCIEVCYASATLALALLINLKDQVLIFVVVAVKFNLEKNCLLRYEKDI